MRKFGALLPTVRCPDAVVRSTSNEAVHEEDRHELVRLGQSDGERAFRGRGSEIGHRPSVDTKRGRSQDHRERRHL
jgi:hypothetical protein